MYSCEVPKPESYTISSREPIPYFGNSEIYWHIVNFSPDLPEHEQIMIFRDVFAHFNYQLWPLLHLSTEHIDRAYIRIAFVEKDLIVKDYHRKELFQCPFDFNLNPGTLAVAFPRHGNKYDGWVFVNEEFMWSMIHAKGKYSLQKVLIHEVAHLFGLGHTDAPGDIMNPKYDPLNKWTSDSRAALNLIYGKIRYDAYLHAPEAESFYDRLTAKESRTRRRCKLFVNRKLK